MDENRQRGDLGEGYRASLRDDPSIVPHVLIYRTDFQDGLELTPYQALSLLAWLEQQRETLTALTVEKPL